MNVLSIHLEQNGKKHLYEQIYEHIKSEIREGRLSCGERLPSARALAVFLQVSRSTVDLAYDQLSSEGYIESVPYKGYYVCRIEGLYHIEPLLDAQKVQGGKGRQRWRYDFDPAGLELSEFPFNTWRKISRRVLSEDRRELFALGEPMGERRLRETIARYIHASRGVNCRAEQILIGAGNEYLLMLLCGILGRGRVVAMEDPTYMQAYRTFAGMGCEMRSLAADAGGLSEEALRAADADIVYAMPSHQYPLGLIMPIGRRLALLKWAAEGKDRYVIEDDYDSEFRYRGRPIPSLQSADACGRVIYMGTFSKSIAPAIRISYLVLPERLLPVYHETSGFLSSTVSRIDQAILDEFINEGYYERHLNRMRAIYKNKHDALLQALKEKKAGFTVSGENAGLHLLLHVPGRPEEELVRRAREADVKVYGISGCCAKMPDFREAVILLGYGGMSVEEIPDGVKALLEAWELL